MGAAMGARFEPGGNHMGGIEKLRVLDLRTKQPGLKCDGGICT
jgi:hypothetical protein